jgi:UPF0271 protein
VRYVKPHGALYNAIVHHDEQAAAVVRAVVEIDPTLPLLALPGSSVARLADRAGLRVVAEAFPDRAYTCDGRLVPRTQAGAVVHDPGEVARRAVQLAVDGTVRTADGGTVRLAVESLCVHGDTPQAVAVAAATRQALDAAGVPVAGFL